MEENIIAKQHAISFLDADFPVKRCSEEQLKERKSEFYFIICSGKLSIEEIKNETRKYLWNKEKCQKYGIKRVGTRNLDFNI